MPNHAPRTDDKFARESFSLRQMKPWQVWSISIVAVLVVLALLGWVL